MSTLPVSKDVSFDEVTIVEPGFNPIEHIVNYEPESKEHESNTESTLPLSPSEIIMRKYLMRESLGSHHVEIYDNWIMRSAHNNVSSRILNFKDGRVVCFENLKILPARYSRDGKVLAMTPKLAREQGVTYGSDWHVDVVIRQGSCTGKELERKVGVCIGNIPIMLKSQYCILRGKTPKELALMGEDPNDPSGYFIVSGVEKVVLLQEQLAVNKIFLMNMDNKSSLVCRMTAQTPKGTSIIELALDKTRNMIKIRFPSMRGTKEGKSYRSLNVLRIFRIFQIADPDAIKELISKFIKPKHVKKCMFKLSRNLVDFLVDKDDIEIMATKMNKQKLTLEEKQIEVMKILDIDLFPHLYNLPGPDGETIAERASRIAKSKIYLLSIMIARFLEHLAGFRALNDRDSWSNKRTEGAGRMMEQLFRSAWRKALGLVQAGIETGSVNDANTVVEKLRYGVITDTFRDSFISSNWGVKGTQMKNNIAQTLSRDSVVSTMAHINTIDVSISRTDRQQSLRMVQNTQWGFIDAISTPEGENAGILKNLCITTKVAIDRDDTLIIRHLIGDKALNLPARVTEDDVNPAWADKLIVNGKFLGWCDGEAVKTYLVQLRRFGNLYPDMSVIKEDDWVYVDIGPSRLVRPLLIVNEDQNLVIDELGIRDGSPREWLTSGAMEFISPWEQEYIKSAAKVDDIRKRKELFTEAENNLRIAAMDLQQATEETLTDAQDRYQSALDAKEKLKNNLPYTHCELDPSAQFSVASALIPWPDHNQAPRNTYQAAMGKQALGIYSSNHLQRFDGKTKILVYPNRPIAETEMYNILNLDTRGPGENIYGSFMAFPYTDEDSFVVKKEFLDNGGFRMYKYLTYKTIVNHSGDVQEKLTLPAERPGEPSGRYKYIQMYEEGNPMNGLPKIGAPLRQGDCVTAKTQFVKEKGKTTNESTMLRVGDEGVVEKILVTSDNKTTVVIVKLRVMRVPEEGDKFAPRNAQKGTIGLVMSDIDMPYDENGVSPDLITNPASMPSRMTLSYPMEILASKYGAMKGTHVNCGAFKPFEMNKYRELLKEYGMNEFGYEKMRSGTSGKPLVGNINAGLVFFQALRHHVKDKIQARGTGQVRPMTRQPPKGRGARGGLRYGITLPMW